MEKSTKIHYSIVVIDSSFTKKTLPLISSSENSLSTFKTADLNFDMSGGCMFSTIIPGQDFIGYISVFKKSLSCVNNILPSELAALKSAEFRNPLVSYFMSIPSPIRNFTSLNLIFSSANSFSLMDENNSFTCQFFCGIMECCLNVFLGKRRIVCYNLLISSSLLQHFQYQIHHDPCTFEDRFSMADLRVNYNIFVDFDCFHEAYNVNEVFKTL